MIGNPRWFKRRKYGGWGFYPACWQGWVYLGILLVSFWLIQLIPSEHGGLRVWIMVAWAIVLSADAFHIILAMPKDEREVVHEAKAERNALWAMVLVLCLGTAYQVASSAVEGLAAVDPVIVAALVAGLVVKAATNVYFDAKE